MWKSRPRKPAVAHPLTESLIRVPVNLCSLLAARHQVFNGQTVQILVSCELTDHVKVQPIDIDPATLDPFILGLLDKLLQCIIVYLVRLYAVGREVDYGDVALLVQVCKACSCFLVLHVNTGLSTRLFPRSSSRRLVVTNSVRTRHSSAQVGLGGGTTVRRRQDLLDVRLGCGCCGRSRRSASGSTVRLTVKIGVNLEPGRVLRRRTPDLYGIGSLRGKVLDRGARW
jgi:hypothetical protein